MGKEEQKEQGRGGVGRDEGSQTKCSCPKEY